jgi:hypothetical protein
VPSENVDTHVGDSDPLLAIEDSLRQFPADEVIVVTRPGESTWLEDGVGERRGGASTSRSCTSSPPTERRGLEAALRRAPKSVVIPETGTGAPRAGT